jgi:hypothetical protein
MIERDNRSAGLGLGLPSNSFEKLKFRKAKRLKFFGMLKIGGAQ